jgi:hypothetical protein
MINRSFFDVKICDIKPHSADYLPSALHTRILSYKHQAFAIWTEVFILHSSIV